MGAAQVELPEGFELDAPPDGFDVDTDDPYAHVGPPQLSKEEQGRYAQPEAVRALAALEKLKRAASLPRPPGVSVLEPDEADALRAMLSKGGAQHDVTGRTLEAAGMPRLASAARAVGDVVGPDRLDAMNMSGGNAMGLGFPAALTGGTQQLRQAQQDYPAESLISSIVGTAATGAMLPGGALSQAAQGSALGWNGSDGESLPERLRQAGEGALYGAVLAKHAPGAIGAAGETIRDARLAMQGAKAGAGQGMQKLASWLGAKKPAANEVPQDYASQAATAAAHEAGPGAEAAERAAVSERISSQPAPGLDIDPGFQSLKRPIVPREPMPAPDPQVAARRLSTDELRQAGPDPVFSPGSYENRSMAGRDPFADFLQNQAHSLDVPGAQDVVTNPHVQEIMRRVQAIDARAKANAPGFADEPTATMAAHQRPDFGMQQTLTKARPFDPFADAPTDMGPPPPPPPGSSPDKTRNFRVGSQSQAAEDIAQAKQAAAPWDAVDSEADRPGSLLREPSERDYGDADKPWWWSLHYEPGGDAAREAAGDAAVNLRGERWNAMMDDTHGRWKPSQNAPMSAPELDQAALAKIAGREAPQPLRFGTKQNAWDKMKDASGIDDYDAARGDAAYKAWKAGAGPKPDPFPGGHFDEINSQLNRKPGRGVSGGLEAFEGLTRGRKTWDDINTAVRLIRNVPGMEKFDLPPDIQEKILQQRMASEAGGGESFDFGANVDPKAGQRGHVALDLLTAMTGMKAGKLAGQMAGKYVAGPMLNKVGGALESSAKQSMTADAAARYAARDPSVLMSLVRNQGAAGGAARSILQALQQGDRQTVKAQSLLLEMMPEFREQFAQDRAGQDRGASAASRY